MKRKAKISFLPAAAVAVATCVAIALLQAAPPRPGPRPKAKPKLKPKPKPVVHPHPRPKPGPKVRPKIHPKLRRRPPLKKLHPRRLRPVVLPARRRGVVHKAPAPVVVTTAAELKPAPAADLSESSAHKVARVGEDFSVVLLIEGQQTPVRLIGVQAPSAALATPAQMKEADEFLRNLLDGEFVHLSQDPDLAEQDADGNTVGYLYRAPDGLFVNLELIRQGHAVAASDYTCSHQELLTFYEGKARADGKGIWKNSPAAAQETTKAGQ